MRRRNKKNLQNISSGKQGLHPQTLAAFARAGSAVSTNAFYVFDPQIPQISWVCRARSSCRFFARLFGACWQTYFDQKLI